jgi:hypothetical protein
MAVRSPTGKTFPGNFTIIPSAKKWVFHAIYYLAFLSLCGKHINWLNRLVITDEEDAEYCSFETLILIHELFWSSTVMLCMFHAIWQPFKRDIHHLLPSKKRLTKHTTSEIVLFKLDTLFFSCVRKVPSIDSTCFLHT